MTDQSKPPKPNDRPASPRHKEKKEKSRSAQHKIVQTHVDDLARVSGDIPDETALGLGRAIMAFSEMEMSADHFIWSVLSLETEDGKLLFAGFETLDKFEAAKKLSERYAIPIHGHPQSAAEVWTLLRTIVQARNKMAHGVWRMIDGKTPIAVSYRIPSEVGTINSEHFPTERLDQIAISCTKIRNLFIHMTDRALALRQTPSAQSRPRTPSRDESQTPKKR